MTYDELSMFGRLRKLEMCGPVEMFRKLANVWSRDGGMSLSTVAAKVWSSAMCLFSYGGSLVHSQCLNYNPMYSPKRMGKKPLM